MKPKFILQAALFTAVSALGWLLPLAQVRADEPGPADESVPADELSPVNSPSGQVIPFACYNRAGNLVFVTVNPQDTLGWDLGCREVQYTSSDVDSPPIDYFQCFNVNGNTVLITVDAKVARDFDLYCRRVGTRLSNPVAVRPTFYECFTATGDLAFTTSYPQDTFGWKPGCRELQYQAGFVAEQSVLPSSSYECLDTSGNVAFITTNQQEARRWRIGCREVRL
ncbi:hypothetical protein [Rivularia sp. UHCC 0363]|uniref:hypothetical protein n=1 Tax=Rivularia sp. UHCC 0363 TaxID=3110244 RepID=UPI002B2198B3|nr:hypothetical protein [Rivularia sp. UHCC 0363]MEA5597426.1 hypothetical protein [Rivularia sp. UHCC 0363]